VRNAVSGPSAEERARERSLLWGRVEDGEGRSVEGSVETLEGYALTAETAALAVERVLRREVEPGAFTPSKAFGARFIEKVRDTKMSVPARAPADTAPRKAARKD
jgi:short subunit dehydrogenase-like uncharacterized protein